MRRAGATCAEIARKIGGPNVEQVRHMLNRRGVKLDAEAFARICRMNGALAGSGGRDDDGPIGGFYDGELLRTDAIRANERFVVQFTKVAARRGWRVFSVAA